MQQPACVCSWPSQTNALLTLPSLRMLCRDPPEAFVHINLSQYAPRAHPAALQTPARLAGKLRPEAPPFVPREGEARHPEAKPSGQGEEPGREAKRQRTSEAGKAAAGAGGGGKEEPSAAKPSRPSRAEAAGAAAEKPPSRPSSGAAKQEERQQAQHQQGRGREAGAAKPSAPASDRGEDKAAHPPAERQHAAAGGFPLRGFSLF